MALLLEACTKAGETYTYINRDEADGFVISKAVYLEDELKLYIDNLKGDFTIVTYDKNFKSVLWLPFRTNHELLYHLLVKEYGNASKITVAKILDSPSPKSQETLYRNEQTYTMSYSQNLSHSSSSISLKDF